MPSPKSPKKYKEWKDKLSKALSGKNHPLCNKYLYFKKHQTHIYHIDYNKNNNQLNNLITLCSSCHGRTNGNRLTWTDYFTTYLKTRLATIKQ